MLVVPKTLREAGGTSRRPGSGRLVAVPGFGWGPVRRFSRGRVCGRPGVPAVPFPPRRRRGDAEAVRPLDSSSLFRTIETCWNDCELRVSRGVSEVSVFSVPLGPASGIIFISGGGGNVRPCVWCVQPPLFCTCPVQSHSRAVIPVRKPLERGGAFLMGKSYRMRLSRG